MNKIENLSTKLNTNSMAITTPFLKWAGGKRKLAPIISALMPENFFTGNGRFFEPFIGGGALTFYLGDRAGEKYIPGERLIISDTNEDLITTYIVIKDNLDELIVRLMELSKNINKDFFYEMRLQNPTTPVEKAARVIFLNKTCFNGLWRVNSKGQFNVPWGHYKKPRLFDEDNLMACSVRLKNSKIFAGHFESVVTNSNKDDFVYFDPPYLPLSSSSNFSKYARADFGTNEHELLSGVIKQLTKKGVKMILSNSDTPLSREIFGSELNLYQLGVQRNIAAKSSSRIKVSEIIATNYKIKNLPTDQLLIKID